MPSAKPYSNIFRATVARSAQANLVSNYLNFRDATGDAVGIPWAEHGQGHMGGSLSEHRELVHGGMDSTVPSYLADEVFVALRGLDKDVTYLKYPREGHWEGSWNFADMQDELDRILEFFNTHLKSGRQK